MKYVAPAYLLIVFVAFAVDEPADLDQGVRDEPLRQGALALLIAAVTVLMIFCTHDR